MLYEWEVDSSVVSEEVMIEIAQNEIDDDDLWESLKYQIENRGFDWLWRNLSENARVEILDLAVGNYCDVYFTEVEDEHDVD